MGVRIVPIVSADDYGHVRCTVRTAVDHIRLAVWVWNDVSMLVALAG